MVLDESGREVFRINKADPDSSAGNYGGLGQLPAGEDYISAIVAFNVNAHQQGDWLFASREDGESVLGPHAG